MIEDYGQVNILSSFSIFVFFLSRSGLHFVFHLQVWFTKTDLYMHGYIFNCMYLSISLISISRFHLMRKRSSCLRRCDNYLFEIISVEYNASFFMEFTFDFCLKPF